MPDAPALADQPNARGFASGRALIVLAAVLWSTSGFFAKAPLFDNWPGPVLAFWRALFACLVLLPLVRRPRWNWKLPLMGLTFAAMNFTYLTALKQVESANAIWLQSTAPLWVLAAGLVLGERVTRGDWLMLAFVALGMGLILAHEIPRQNAAGVWMGLISGVFYAGVVLWLRRLRDQEPAWLIGWNHLVTALALAPWALPLPWMASPSATASAAATPLVWPSGWQWAWLAAFGALQMGAPYVLFARGLKQVSGHQATLLALLEPVLVPIWVFVAWGRHPDYQAPRWWTLVGAALILSGLLASAGWAATRPRPVRPIGE